MMQGDEEYMTVGDAQKYLDVTGYLMARYIKEGLLTTHRKPQGDRRVKWIRRVDVENFRKRMGETKKLTPAA